MNKNITLLVLSALLLTACASQQQKSSVAASKSQTNSNETRAIPLSEEVIAALQVTRGEPIVSTEIPATTAFKTETRPRYKQATRSGPSIWPRLRSGYALNASMKQSRVRSEISYYQRHPSYIKRVLDRGDRYLHYILEQTEKRGIPNEIALLPIVESAFHPFAYSHGRAAGLWQFIPGTGKHFGLKQNWWYDGRRDVIASTDAALNYLQSLHRRFDGDWLLALAAYNSGGGTVNKAVRKNRKAGKPIDFWNLDLPKETRGYVPKLLAISAVLKDPSRYNIDLPKVANKPAFEIIETGGQIDLALAADLAGLSMDELYWFNPAYNQWATDPSGPHQLLIPSNRAAQFSDKLAKLPKEKRIKWKRYKIANGDVLGKVAKRHSTSVDLIRKVNDIKGNNIRAGKYLIIPVATRSLNNYTLSAQQRLASKQNRPRKGSKQHHIVRKGDTLWDISRKYGVSSGALAKWNNMAPRDTLRLGQKLVVWVKPKSSNKVASSNGRPPASIRSVRYTVRSGDSLARISNKFNVSVKDLLRWNKINKKKYLQPGQKLTLYVDVTQQSGNI